VTLYSMPLWLALMAHFWLPGERTTPEKVAGQGRAFFGVAISIIWRGSGGVDRPEGRRTRPAVGLASIGLGADLYDSGTVFCRFISDVQPILLCGLAFQFVVIVTFGFARWLWLLSVYPPAIVAAFSFLSPVFDVFSAGCFWMKLWDCPCW
jgi:drug/metabolite transporter (DMT)-like permease